MPHMLPSATHFIPRHTCNILQTCQRTICRLLKSNPQIIARHNHALFAGHDLAASIFLAVALFWPASCLQCLYATNGLCFVQLIGGDAAACAANRQLAIAKFRVKRKARTFGKKVCRHCSGFMSLPKSSCGGCAQAHLITRIWTHFHVHPHAYVGHFCWTPNSRAQSTLCHCPAMHSVWLGLRMTCCPHDCVLQVRYESRQRLAEARPRVKGQFVKAIKA